MAYGSRVTGNAHDGSDLDLVMIHPEFPDQPQDNGSELRSALIESNIPILVDVLDWARIPEAFKAEIIKNYVVVQGDSDILLK